MNYGFQAKRECTLLLLQSDTAPHWWVVSLNLALKSAILPYQNLYYYHHHISRTFSNIGTAVQKYYSLIHFSAQMAQVHMCLIILNWFLNSLKVPFLQNSAILTELRLLLQLVLYFSPLQERNGRIQLDVPEVDCVINFLEEILNYWHWPITRTPHTSLWTVERFPSVT